MTTDIELSGRRASLDTLLTHIQQLSRRRDMTFSEWATQLLEIGANYFAANAGKLTCVGDQELQVVECYTRPAEVGGSFSACQAGDTAPLSTSFCGIAVSEQTPILAADTRVHDKLKGHLFIKSLPVAYWGVAIYFNGVVWGTLSFCGETVGEAHPLDEEALLLMAGLLELKLENEEYREEVRGARESYRVLSQRLEKIQHVDALTELPNRGALFDYLHREVNQLIRRDGEGAIALVDIDFFHMFNEQHGHEEGDRILKGVAVALRQAVRNYDYVARYSGEQFLVWFPDTLQSEVAKVCVRMAEHVAQCEVDGTPVTISVGYCAFRSDSEEKIPFSKALDKLINLAHGALVEAKGKGRNCAISASKRPVTITSLS
ncbi:GGDEF domain-containing protein [Enterovibrio sp. ZSDZ42]|uniref:diguanylate cyclase n=1 Tax=Enterovibrio gelatinilyticus TaxID=2899819 RepID=A0ABT5QXU2_9GAMM|nr:GGDEF domain-containing protein [Enterovibrio sp. ZSDZ42]MDD1792845.1 GGDEF domain-containing protein [Enterovibrio sp. ZSDZ42]